MDARPTTKINTVVYKVLLDEFENDKSKKVASHEVGEEKRKEKESLRIIQEKKEQDRLEKLAKREEIKTNRVALEKPKSIGKIDLKSLSNTPIKKNLKKTKDESSKEEKKDLPKPSVTQELKKQILEDTEPTSNPDSDEEGTLETKYQKLSGPKTTGQKINLDEVNEKEKTVEDARKRK